MPVTFAKKLEQATAHAGEENSQAMEAVRNSLSAVWDKFQATFPEGYDRDLSEVEDAVLGLGTRAASMIRSNPAKALGGR